jgi:hypothetical protein
MKKVKRHLVLTAVITAWILAFALISLPVCAEEKKSGNEVRPQITWKLFGKK